MCAKSAFRVPHFAFLSREPSANETIDSPTWLLLATFDTRWTRNHSLSVLPMDLCARLTAQPECTANAHCEWCGSARGCAVRYSNALSCVEPVKKPSLGECIASWWPHVLVLLLNVVPLTAAY